jgi:nucleoside-diphosphate-sugar epimerase
MVYGVGFRGDFVTIARVVKTGVFPKIGFGKNLSPALYIDDVVDCLSRAKSQAAVGQTYIISSSESYELERVVHIIASALHVNVHMIFVPTCVAVFGAWLCERTFLLLGKNPVVTARNIVSAATDRVFDVTKAQRELGFQPRVSIEQGLARTVGYYQAQGYV